MSRACYKVAVVGARRGLHHCRGYDGLEDRARLVGVAEIDPERRAAAQRVIGGRAKVYADWLEMLDREQPDVLHIVTLPAIPRAVWVLPAAAAGVKVLAVEKPVALWPSEVEELSRVAEDSGLRIAVNLQRRYMPFADKLRSLLEDDERGLGAVHFVRGSIHGKVSDMYPHLLDLLLLAVADAKPTYVWATAEGREEDERYPGPRSLLAEYSFESGVRAFYEASPQEEPPFGWRDFGMRRPALDPPGRDSDPHRCNIDIWAERGRFWWHENGTWGYQVEGQPQHATPTAFTIDDLPAQQAYSKALLDWLEDVPHHCELSTAVLGFEMQSGALQSAATNRRLAYPSAARLSDDEYQKLLDSL